MRACRWMDEWIDGWREGWSKSMRERQRERERVHLCVVVRGGGNQSKTVRVDRNERKGRVNGPDE